MYKYTNVQTNVNTIKIKSPSKGNLHTTGAECYKIYIRNMCSVPNY